MTRIYLLNKQMSRRYVSTHFQISAPDYLVKKGVFRSRVQPRMLKQLQFYATRLGEIAQKFYSKWLKPGEVGATAYRRNAQAQLVGRTTFTNPIFPFVEWNTKPHMPPLLRAKDNIVGRKKPKARAPGLKRVSRIPATLTDARIEGTNTLSKRAKVIKPPVERIANSGITRWSAEHGRNKWYVQKLISIRGTTGKFAASETQKKIADELEVVLVGQIMDVLNGFS
jgi:hypothetical protein